MLIYQGLTFFFAGYETSSTTLSLASYLLATNPEVQDKLIAEIDTLAPGRDDVTYESITKMTYLDNVISESLRIYPPAVMYVANKDANKVTYNCLYPDQSKNKISELMNSVCICAMLTGQFGILILHVQVRG